MQRDLAVLDDLRWVLLHDIRNVARRTVGDGVGKLLRHLRVGVEHGDVQDSGVRRVVEGDLPTEGRVVILEAELLDDVLHDGTGGDEYLIVLGELGTDLQVREAREGRLLTHDVDHRGAGVGRGQHEA